MAGMQRECSPPCLLYRDTDGLGASRGGCSCSRVLLLVTSVCAAAGGAVLPFPAALISARRAQRADIASCGLWLCSAIVACLRSTTPSPMLLRRLHACLHLAASALWMVIHTQSSHLTAARPARSQQRLCM